MLLTLSACDSKPKEKDSGSAAPKETTSASKKEEKDEVVATAESLPEEAVRAVVDRWLSAQNAGKFEDYEKVFAERFEGTKRVGSRTHSYDRKSWLEDRKNMFKKDFTVKVDDLQIASSGTSAVVQFKQTWTSATFQDEGPKRLIVVKGKDGLEIAKEEMLNSTLVGASGSQFSLSPRHFSFVWNDQLILRELHDLKGVTGHPAPTSGNTTSRPMEPKALEKDEQSYIGEEFFLYGKEGKLCKAKVKGLKVHVELQPHFGQEQYWSGFNGEPAVSPMQRALELWELSAMGGRFVAAEFDLPKGCTGATWARASSLPEAAVWKSRVPTDEERKKILAEVRKQEPYRLEQKAYHGDSGETTPWEETKGGTTRIMVFEGPAGAQYADVSMFHANGGCGADYEGLFWAMVRKKGEGYVSVNAAPEAHVDSAWPRLDKVIVSDSGFDLDGDGVPEFVGGYDLIKKDGDTFRAVFNISPAYFDCPC